MTLPRISLRSFLVQAKATLRTAISKGQKVTLVIGNESADLDSLTSSLLYAYIRSASPPVTAFTPFYVPITNIPASDVQLRPEFLALLPHANIEQQHLITLDDLSSNGKQPLAPDLTSWILVDHNALQGELGKRYSKRVCGVIDHHEDEKAVSEDIGCEPRIIANSGSCTSLVTKYCHEAWDTMSLSAQSSGAANAPSDGNSIVNDAAFASLWDAQVAKLAMASILIDTHNLQSGDKVTVHDLEAVRYLEAKIASSIQGSKNFNRDRFFKEISEAKEDIDGLKLYDILRKDYKEWTEGSKALGISSVVKSIDFLVGKAKSEKSESGADSETFLSSLKSFAEDRKLDILAIMTHSTSEEGEFQRELLVWAFEPDCTSMGTKFEEAAKEELGLAAWQGSIKDIDHEGKDEWRKIWKQKQIQHSRKRVAPLLREAMR